MKQGKLIRRAVSAALAGCMMFTLSAPALAESTDTLMQLNISGNRAVSVLDAENGYGITVNGVEVTDANKDDVLAGTLNAGKLRYENGALCSDNVQLSGILRVTAPGTNIELNGGERSPLATIYINGADNVTISSDKYSAIGNKAEIDCTGKVTINASGDYGSYAVGARSRADEGTLIIRNASAVEINAPQYNQVIGGWKGIADITCNGPVTIRGNAEGGRRIANSFAYQRTDGADYVYFTSEDAETEAIDGSITPIPSDAPYSYLHIEEKTFSAITVNNGIAKVGGSEAQTAFNGQKVTVTAQIDETDERKFDGWEVVNAPAGFTISAEKLAQKEFSFIMPTGNVELTAHHSNKLEVSDGTATVNGNAVDFARPQADVSVTAADRSADGYQFDHWEVSGGDIGKSGDDLKANPLNFTMPDAAVKLTAVYRAAVKVSNGTAQVGTESGETVYALKGDTVTVTGHDSNASFSKLVGWKLKKGSLTAIIDADGNSLNVTVDAENNYLLDASGAKIKNETFTFTMSDKPVELSAVYSIPAIAMSLPVIVEGGTINGTQDSFVLVKAGEKVTIKADAPAENMQFHHWKVEEGTSADFGVTIGTLGSDTEQGTEEITFIMPRGAVKLTAHHSNKLEVSGGTAKVNGNSNADFARPGAAVTVTADSPEDYQFDHWEVSGGNIGKTEEQLKVSPLSFTMPDASVKLNAVYKAAVKVSNGTAQTDNTTGETVYALEGASVTVTADSPEDYQFDHWEVSGGNIGKTEEELKVSPLSFTMPDASVKLNAVYKAAVKVSNGTAQTDNTTGETVYALEGASVTVTGHDSNASSSKLVGWKLKKGSLTAIIDADGNSLNVTVDAEDNYLLDASGAKIKNETFTFIMSDKPVELSAVYSIPAIAMSLPVIVEGGTINGTQDSFARVKAGEKVTIKADAPAENMQFHHWKVEEGTSADFSVTIGTLGSDTEQGTEEITFIMPRGAVKLTAHHSNRLEVSGGTATVNGNSVDFARPKAVVTVTADNRSAEGYQFDHWEVSGGNIGKTEEELKVSPLSFTMPDAAVKLNAVYKAAVKVSNGTAQTDNTTGETVYALEGASVTVTGHDSNASSSKLVGWKLKKGSLTAIIDADGNSLNVTVDAEDNYLLDASGAKIKNETFTFIISDKPVELSAVYSIPAIAMSLPVIVEGGTINGTQDSFARVKAGEKVTVKADAPAEHMQFHHWKVEEGTSADFGVTIGTLGSDTEQGTEEITFIMPRGAVKLTAQWSATPATRPDPDQPLDEDFGVDTPQPKPDPEEPEEPEAPAESAAGAIAAVAIGGAAVWGGYEITTRAILKNLLPADAVIPKTQGQLAELLWQNAGCPQPTVAQATDAAAAARWCVEQGYLEEDFAPEKYVPKYKVIRILKQAKSAT